MSITKQLGIMDFDDHWFTDKVIISALIFTKFSMNTPRNLQCNDDAIKNRSWYKKTRR